MHTRGVSFLRARPFLVVWLLVACGLGVAALWDALPLLVCGPWVAAVLWALARNPQEGAAAPPSYAEAARRRLTIR